MGATNSSSKQMKFYSLKGKASAEESPNFALTEKVADKWQVTGNFDTMTGYLNSAEIKEKEYQGAKFNVFVLEIQDDNETSKVEMTHNSVTHSLINSLASDCNKLDEYSFVVKKKQTKGKDGKQYWNGTAYVNVKGKTESLRWSIDPQSAPKKEPVMVNGTQFIQNGKGVWDDSKVRIFWEDIFRNKIIGALGAPVAKPQSSMPAASSPTEAQTPNLVQQNDQDDLPF
jgi:hypothetical protein